MSDYRELAKDLEYEGHLWSGKPALLFFRASDAINALLDQTNNEGDKS